ncbi:hypothetical protein FGU71_05020 [Erythrobacter insulae]|uniref:Uncharacterized protein n=1 Tax=Erythrobacter insulae TaxID=2584124 RepID=A0A547PAV1_9SPHN|nr:hypothetical protein [Erythrobacter insulae]TRD11272.1 hypothetical protein FGU71_05020 [Erythrobacter insulae]
MSLFTPDLFRNFVVGFAVGAVIVGAATIDQWSDQIAPPAQAAAPLEAPQPSDDFWSIAE